MSGSVPSALQDGQTPLHIAAGKGHKEVVGLLIDRGASVEVMDYVSGVLLGCGPLHTAAGQYTMPPFTCCFANRHASLAGILCDERAAVGDMQACLTCCSDDPGDT